MILVDTGFWLALASRRDSVHGRAIALVKTLTEPLLTTWPVMTETCHLLVTRVSVEASVRFIANYQRGTFRVENMPNECGERLLALMQRYADLPMDLADASLVLLAEQVGHGRIVSTDRRDFKTYRWKNRKPFQNLLFPDD